MPRQTPALAASLLAVLVVLLLDLAGAFTGVNHRLIDTQQRLMPRSTAPFDDAIVFVDIDDGSIDRLGRWPWARSTVADAIHELRRAGVRTIAVDVEFSDPQNPTWDDETKSLRDEDARLADALDQRAVMATVLGPDELDQRWVDSGGNLQTLSQLVEALKHDITALPDRLPGNLELSEDDVHAFELNQLLVKRRAATQVLSGESPPDSLAALESHLVPARHQHGGSYPEHPLVETAWRHHQSRLVAGPLLSKLDDAKTGSPTDRMPLLAFLKKAGGLGYVNITHRGVDGNVRSIYPTQTIRGGMVLSLGLAAVAHYLGINPQDIQVASDTVTVGDVELPLHNDVVWLNWPRSPVSSRWRDLHRRSSADPDYRGHLSISEIVELARARRTLASQRNQLADISRDLIRFIRQDPQATAEDWLASELQDEILGEIEFNLDGVDLDAEPEEFAAGEDEATFRILIAMQQWRRVRAGLDDGSRRLMVSESMLSDQVRDALVFIGWTSTGAAADFIGTVAGPRTPGVLVHATLADMVLQKRPLFLAADWVDPVSVLVLGLFIALITTLLGPWWATAVSFLTLIVWISLAGILALAFFHLVMPLVAPVISGLAAWTCGMSVQAAIAQRDKRRITRQFRARVSEQLVDALIADPEAVSMSGVSREMTVFFCDLAGFTTLSEALGSEQIVRILNTYLSALTSQLVEHGAYVNKFLGDGVMAFWSAFQEEPTQAHLACAAALACQETVAKLNQHSQGEHPPIGLRIGLATGTAVVGDCGAPPDLNDYTVIGDTVNLASRLESANKQFGTGIMVNDRTYACLDGAPIRMRCIGSIQVVGRQQAVLAWEVVGRDYSQEVIDLSATLHEAVCGGDQAAAAAAIEGLRQHPDQAGFVARWAELVEGSAEDFHGPLRLIEK